MNDNWLIEPLKEPDAVSRQLGNVECAGSCVVQGIAPLRAAQAQPDSCRCSPAARLRRNRDRRRSALRAGDGCLAGGEGQVDAALDGGGECWRRLHPVGVDASVDDEAE